MVQGVKLKEYIIYYMEYYSSDIKLLYLYRNYMKEIH